MAGPASIVGEDFVVVVGVEEFTTVVQLVFPHLVVLRAKLGFCHLDSAQVDTPSVAFLELVFILTSGLDGPDFAKTLPLEDNVLLIKLVERATTVVQFVGDQVVVALREEVVLSLS